MNSAAINQPTTSVASLTTIHQVFIAETLSIVVMEATQVLVQVFTPGVMQAGLLSWIFWLGMGLALVAGYIAAFPVNYVLVGKGIRHVH